jgi:hypothetical protein
MQDIALGEDADALTVGVVDNRGTDLADQHLATCFAQRVIGPDGQHRGAHGVAHLHGAHPPWSCRPILPRLAASDKHLPPISKSIMHRSGAPAIAAGQRPAPTLSIMH